MTSRWRLKEPDADTRSAADEAPGTYLIKTFELDQPRQREILVKLVASGLARTAFASNRKAGTVVVVSVGTEPSIPISLAELIMYQKRIQGWLFGASIPSWDILRQAELYRAGRLKLDELITADYELNDAARGYEDMHAGNNLRGMIRF